MLMVGAAAASEFWYPAAKGVLYAAPDGQPVWICSYNGWPTTENWKCYKSLLAEGAKVPLGYYLDDVGPVKVIGAKWAYAIPPSNTECWSMPEFIKPGKDSDKWGFDPTPVCTTMPGQLVPMQPAQ